MPQRLAGGAWWAGPWQDVLAAGVLEPKRGYRYKPENVALARALQGLHAQSVVDLGCGTGSLLLIAEVFTRPRQCVGVEIQAESVLRARRTFAAHDMHHVTIINGDLRTASALSAARHLLDGAADLVVMNPPFFPVGWGRPSANQSTRASTHAEHGGVGDFLRAAAMLSADAGRCLCVYDAARLAELLAEAEGAGLRAERLLWIPDQRPGRDGQPFRVWVRFARPEVIGEPGLVVERLG